MNKTHLLALVGIIIVGGAGFYAGVVYGKNQTTTTTTRTQFGQGQFAGRAGRGSGGNTVGQVLSKDATSMTLQTPDGSTKIVLFSTSTQIMKTTPGGLSDVSPKETVVINGQPNSDGSITAQSIQIRPAGMTGFGGRQP